MNKQPTLNIAFLGHVSNGKTKTTLQITKQKTQRHSFEKKNDMTVNLGYANAKIFKCGTCPSPSCYSSSPSNVEHIVCCLCENEMELVKHMSIIDCPGHNNLMATMLNCVGMVDAAILVESVVNDEIPSPQTIEHAMVTELAKIPLLAICMNKLDLVPRSDAEEQIIKMRNYTNGTNLSKSPIVPIVANYGININVLLELIHKFEKPEQKTETVGNMMIVRSFNVNKQYIDPDKLLGGVIGGSILKGSIAVGDNVTILPGVKINENDKWFHKPLKSTVLSIKSEKVELDRAMPGGLIALQLDLDPGLFTQNRMVGNILTVDAKDNDGLQVFNELYVKYVLLNTSVIETVTSALDVDIAIGDELLINVNAMNNKASVIGQKNDIIKLSFLDGPICARVKDYITISKQGSMSGPRIIGRGVIKKGVLSEVF